MKIVRIETRIVNAQMRNWVFVRVETDQPGLYGWGEATLEWKTRAVAGAVEDIAALLVGRDPRDIENLVRVATKHGFWRLGVIGMSAIAGIEQACWDILGKSLGLPVWRLLGGQVRDRVPIYTHLGFGEMSAVYETFSPNALADRAHQVVARGYAAFKIVCVPYMNMTISPRDIALIERQMAVLRETVGDGVEIMVDMHGRAGSVSAAVAVIDALSPFRPMFVEEPIQPGDALSLAEITRKTRVPIATGERLVDRKEFEEVFRLRAVHIAQPDICHVGGLMEAKKIAAMADTAGIGVAPHNPLGPIAGASALHFAVSTPNFVIQEEMSGAVPWYDDVVRGPIRRVDGHWQVPTAPGLGVEVDEAVAAAHPFAPEVLAATQAVIADGTVVDW
jgi:galactonate dehydratase